MTNRENTLRGTSFAAINARKTHCKNGHELSGDNLKLSANGWRSCRSCKRAIDQRRLRNRPHVPPKTHCKYGHEFTADNIRLRANRPPQWRECRKCWRASVKTAHRRKKQRLRAARQAEVQA